MSRDATVEIDWAGGQGMFRLGISELEKVQEACDAGPQFIYNRLRSGTYHINDLRAPILWGLIGGGLTAVDAQKKMSAYFITPLAQHVLVAQVILGAAIFGAPDEDVKEEKESPNPEAANLSQEGK
jgi:hypothetical protein